VPLAVIIPFAILVWNGWAHRRDIQFHKRMMLSAAIITVMGPSIGRLPLGPPLLIVGTVQLLLGLCLFIPLFVHDRRRLGQVQPATKLGFTMGAITVAIPLAVFWFNLPWAKVASHLPGVGV
jgi:hypothetical protein